MRRCGCSLGSRCRPSCRARGWSRSGGGSWSGGGFHGREGDPFRASFDDHEGGIGHGAGSLEGQKAGHGDRAGSLILGVDVVVTGFGAHLEQAWREVGALASPAEESADR